MQRKGGTRGVRVAKGGGRGVKGGGGRGGRGEAAWGLKAVLGEGMFRCFPVGVAGEVDED